jgi:hypothetical protein
VVPVVLVPQATVIALHIKSFAGGVGGTAHDTLSVKANWGIKVVHENTLIQ